MYKTDWTFEDVFHNIHSMNDLGITDVTLEVSVDNLESIPWNRDDLYLNTSSLMHGSLCFVPFFLDLYKHNLRVTFNVDFTQIRSDSAKVAQAFRDIHHCIENSASRKNLKPPFDAYLNQKIGDMEKSISELTDKLHEIRSTKLAYEAVRNPHIFNALKGA